MQNTININDKVVFLRDYSLYTATCIKVNKTTYTIIIDNTVGHTFKNPIRALKHKVAHINDTFTLVSKYINGRLSTRIDYVTYPDKNTNYVYWLASYKAIKE